VAQLARCPHARGRRPPFLSRRTDLPSASQGRKRREGCLRSRQGLRGRALLRSARPGCRRGRAAHPRRRRDRRARRAEQRAAGARCGPRARRPRPPRGPALPRCPHPGHVAGSGGRRRGRRRRCLGGVRPRRARAERAARRGAGRPYRSSRMLRWLTGHTTQSRWLDSVRASKGEVRPGPVVALVRDVCEPFPRSRPSWFRLGNRTKGRPIGANYAKRLTKSKRPQRGSAHTDPGGVQDRRVGRARTLLRGWGDFAHRSSASPAASAPAYSRAQSFAHAMPREVEDLRKQAGKLRGARPGARQSSPGAARR
jgi:hypothetical protein